MNHSVDNPLYVYLHIPKTGGTTLLWNIGNHFDRENDRWLRHYHWMNTQQYLFNNIPLLEKRTVEQQKQLKFLTGHGTYSMVHYWLKVRTDPKFFVTVRDPIDRLLSSFNYRYGTSQLIQDNTNFTTCDPPMDIHSVYNEKYAYDYNTLYEWYLDASKEHNLQCKWIIKSFYHYIDNKFISWSDIINHTNPISPPDIWPDWFESFEIDQYTYSNVLDCIENKIWWAGTTETLTEDTKAMCKYIDTEYVQVDNRHRSGIDFPQYWSRKDVENQPDFHKLVEAEAADIRLYQHVKKYFKRPF